MIIFKDEIPPIVDRKSEQEQKSYEKEINSIVLLNLKFDFYARLVLVGAILVFVIINYYFLIHFINTQAHLESAKRLSENISSNYIKYSIGINSVLLLVISYWFKGKGATSLLKGAMDGLLTRKTNNEDC